MIIYKLIIRIKLFKIYNKEVINNYKSNISNNKDKAFSK